MCGRMVEERKKRQSRYTCVKVITLPEPQPGIVEGHVEDTPLSPPDFSQSPSTDEVEIPEAYPKTIYSIVLGDLNLTSYKQNKSILFVPKLMETTII